MSPMNARQHLRETKSGENVSHKSAGCNIEEQKRPKVLQKGFVASLKCIVPIHNFLQEPAC